MSTCNRLDLQTLGLSTGYAQKSPRSLLLIYIFDTLPTTISERERTNLQRSYSTQTPFSLVVLVEAQLEQFPTRECSQHLPRGRAKPEKERVKNATYD